MKERKLEILLIEDNPTDVALIQEMLAKSSRPRFSVKHVGLLDEGLRLLRNRIFDAVLVDLGLPDSQGLGTAGAIRNESSRVPIVVLTGLDDEETALKSFETGIQDYLVKDEITGKQLVRSIRYAMQRKHTAEETERLYSQQRELNAMLEYSHVMACDLDDRIVYWPLGMRELYGWSKQEAVGVRAYELFGTTFPMPMREIHATLLQEGVWEGELLQHRKDGAVITVASSWFLYRNPQGEPTAVLKTNSDISERRRTEESLREVQEQLQLITDLMSAGVTYCSREHKYLWVSPAYAQWLGMPSEEIAGRGIDEVLGEEALQTLTPYIREVLKGKKVKYEAKVNYREGNIRWVSAEYTPTFNLEGVADGWIAVITDVTAMKELEIQLQQAKGELEQRVAERTAELNATVARLQEEVAVRKKTELDLKKESRRRLKALQELREKEQMLIHQSRMAAMGEMIGFIAHQWRQPLNALGLIVQDLSFRYRHGGFDEQYLEAGKTHAMQLLGQMSQTIDDFRNFFKTEKEKVSFRISEVVSKTLGLVAPSFRDLRLAVEVSEEGEVVVEGYPNEYSQVLLNILINARDACLAREIVNPVVRIRIREENGRGVTIVEDNAGGIPEEIIDRIFDPYFSTKGPDRGTGVGLYMAKTIIEKNMGGRLYVRNTAGGAQFTIEI